MNKKTFLTTVVSATLMAFMAVPALAVTSTTGIIAGSSAPSATVISCVAAAVNARESALDNAIATHGQAVTAAYVARATALQQAYTLASGSGAIKAAVKAAWAAFSASIKTANSAWKTAKTGAWSTFNSSVKTCKAPSSIVGTTSSSSEVTGN